MRIPGWLRTGSGPSSAATYTAAACPSPNVPGVPQLDLGPGFSCGTLTEPEDRSRPDGRRIDLAVTRLAATSPTPRPDPLDVQATRSGRDRTAGGGYGVLPDFPDPVLSLVPQAARIFDDCDVWDVPASDARVHEPTASDVPALLLTGSLDAVTPPSQARTAAETLSRPEVLEFPGLGHDVLQSSDCAPAVTVGFLENPAGGYHTSCLARVQMPSFTTG
nr:alpha/beta hydrolase [Rhodococcus wratislaviensis]